MPQDLSPQDFSDLQEVFNALPADHPIKGKLGGFLRTQQGMVNRQVAATATPSMPAVNIPVNFEGNAVSRNLDAATAQFPTFKEAVGSLAPTYMSQENVPTDEARNKDILEAEGRGAVSRNWMGAPSVTNPNDPAIVRMHAREAAEKSGQPSLIKQALEAADEGVQFVSGISPLQHIRNIAAGGEGEVGALAADLLKFKVMQRSAAAAHVREAKPLETQPDQGPGGPPPPPAEAPVQPAQERAPAPTVQQPTPQRAEEVAPPPKKFYTFDPESGKVVESKGTAEVGRPPEAGQTGLHPVTGQPYTFIEGEEGAEPPRVPGARRADEVAETNIKTIEDLTKAIQAGVPRDASLGNRIASAMNIGEDFRQMGQDVDYAARNFTAGMHRLYDGLNAWWVNFKDPVKWGDYEDATGKWSGAENINAMRLDEFTKEVQKAIPDKLDQQAASIFTEASGDQDLLNKWAAEVRDGPWKKVFKRATELPDNVRYYARLVSERNEAAFNEAKKLGMLKAGVENYVMHLWDNDPRAMRRLFNKREWSGLTTSPKFARHRVLPTYFEGIQAGLTPKDMSLGFLTASHEQAFREAAAARSYVRSLQEGRAADGRKLIELAYTNAKEINPEQAEKADAYILRPNSGKPLTAEGREALKNLRKLKEQYVAQGADPAAFDKQIRKIMQEPDYRTDDYRPIDHQALRGWLWAGETTSGEPILVQGDALVHPDIYNKLRNNLTSSKISSFTIPGTDLRPGAAALRFTGEAKNFLLSFSGFHQTTLGIHALEHRVNPIPFMVPKLDLTNPKQLELINHGLQVAHYNAAEAFGEGLATNKGWLVKGLSTPLTLKVGKVYQMYTDYLFKDLLPRYKMAMATDALERNFKRFGDKLRDDQIYALTAREANAAFGGLNYKLLGRNKTFQDTLRLFMLAPDFTEARLRFVGQSMRPFGREQMVALWGGAAALYTMGRVLNKAIDDDYHWDSPFSIVHGGKEYALRTVQGDTYHLFAHFGDFWKNRMNPVALLGYQLFEGRNSFGDKADNLELVRNFLKNGAPIPAQPWVRGSDDPRSSKIFGTVWKMIGVNEKAFHTPAESFATERSSSEYQMQVNVKREKLARQLAHEYKDGRISVKQLNNMADKSIIPPSVRDKVLNEWEDLTSPDAPLVRHFKKLFPEDALRAYEIASPAEQKQLRPLLEDKMDDLDRYTPEEQQALRKKYSEFLK